MFGIALTIGQAIEWAIEHRVQIEAVAGAAIKYAPQVIQIVKEGATAVQAANKASPELVPHIKDLASGLMKYLPIGSTTTLDEVTEHVARSTFVPGWTDDETQRWWDLKQGQS
jgi:hypothetical protein